MVRYLLSITAVCIVGCEADFEAIEFELEAPDLGPPAPGLDAGASDASMGDAGATPDVDTVVATGEWMFSGFSVEGSLDLVERADGRFEAVFSDDFQSVNLPSPVFFFSDRSSIGRSGIRPSDGDIRIGVLQQVSGPMTFEIPPAAATRRFAWIYCEPVTIEMHVAELESL
ncbi:MAG: hypothetical protein ACFB9M_13500 [Myxococcota bacterium]